MPGNDQEASDFRDSARFQVCAASGGWGGPREADPGPGPRWAVWCGRMGAPAITQFPRCAVGDGPEQFPALGCQKARLRAPPTWLSGPMGPFKPSRPRGGHGRDYSGLSRVDSSGTGLTSGTRLWAPARLCLQPGLACPPLPTSRTAGLCPTLALSCGTCLAEVAQDALDPPSGVLPLSRLGFPICSTGAPTTV